MKPKFNIGDMLADDMGNTFYVLSRFRYKDEIWYSGEYDCYRAKGIESMSEGELIFDEWEKMNESFSRI